MVLSPEFSGKGIASFAFCHVPETGQIGAVRPAFPVHIQTSGRSL